MSIASFAISCFFCRKEIPFDRAGFFSPARVTDPQARSFRVTEFPYCPCCGAKGEIYLAEMVRAWMLLQNALGSQEEQTRQKARTALGSHFSYWLDEFRRRPVAQITPQARRRFGERFVYPAIHRTLHDLEEQKKLPVPPGQTYVHKIESPDASASDPLALCVGQNPLRQTLVLAALWSEYSHGKEANEKNGS